MKRITFGTPELLVPSYFSKTLRYEETDLCFDAGKITFSLTPQGCSLRFSLAADEQVYGFGLQLKEFNHKGRRLHLKVNSDPVAATGDSHAPVPFFATTKGYGIYLDTARYIECYCGIPQKRFRQGGLNTQVRTDTASLYAHRESAEDNLMVINIPAAKGIDLYVFEGDTITDIVAEYNRFSGGGCDVPEWALGVLYRAYAKSTSADVRGLVSYFEQAEIPVNILGLEPGWQSGTYPCTYVWNESNFPDYQALIRELLDKDYHINLWEHCFVSPASPLYGPLYPYSGDFEVWKGIVPDFATQEARELFSRYHKEHLVDLGIDGFKLDECDSSDFNSSDWSFPDCSRFPSGMDGEQYHSMLGVLYMQTMLAALGGRKTLSQIRNAGALCAPYPFVLYSDLYDLPDFIRGVANAGFSGLLWTPEVRDAQSRKEFLRRLQANVFSVQCLINAWYCEQVPWKAWDCEAEVRQLLQVRHQLIPMLKQAFDRYRDTGIPPVRALVSDYTHDPNTYAIDDEYLFCDRLLVAPLTWESDRRRVYLPQGCWRDYWTKEPVASGWFEVEHDSIPVFERYSD